MATVLTLGELATHLDADLRGDPECRIRRLNTLQAAQAGDLAFLANKAYRRYLTTTGASAVILRPGEVEDYSGNALVHDNPYLAYAQVSALFDPVSKPVPGVHPSAQVDDSATVPDSASMGPNAVVEAGVILGEGVQVGPGCWVGENAVIGDHSILNANVSVYHGVSLGRHVRIHSGAVIGADGFGFAPGTDGWVKIHQLGGVEIGDHVEIGAGTTIDRGALGNTVIGNHVIIDNLVQIAHNVKVGDNSALAGCAAIAGSTEVGRNCLLAGGAGLVGHITLCDGVTVTARSMITKSITAPGTYSSGTPFSESSEWRKNAVRFGQLDRLAQRLARLEKRDKK